MNDHTPMNEEEIASGWNSCGKFDEAPFDISYTEDERLTEEFVLAAKTGWPRALAELQHRGKMLDAALEELARTWNGVGMLGKRDWTAAHLLARFQENTR